MIKLGRSRKIGSDYKNWEARVQTTQNRKSVSQS